jgi:LmbE family N-acetylglucosaminyl deacetylase
MRQDEQRAAARALGGAGDVVFLGRVDGELEPGVDERRELAGWIRRLQPDVVLGHDPWRRYRLHPDHRHAGFLVTDAIVAARDPHFFPELALAPHRPSTLLLWEADEPNHVEDVTSSIDAKLRALLEHRSQFRSTHRIDDPADEAQVERFRAHIAARAAEHGADAGFAYGERFRVVADL